MTLGDYQKDAARTAGIVGEDTLDRRLSLAAIGIAGEAGEVCEVIKKHLYHGLPLDKDKVRRELGDVFWYLAFAATTLGLSLDDVASTNIEKLRARYPEKFDPARSTLRDGDAR